MRNLIIRVKTIWNEKHLSFYFSVLATLVFTVYNAYLGLRYKALWNGSISVYYILLLAIKLILVYMRRKNKTKLSNFSFYLSFILMLLVNLALIAPIILMIKQEREVKLSIIAGIAVAAYTTLKVILAIRNYLSYRKQRDDFCLLDVTLGVISAAVSLLTLQNTLIMIVEEKSQDMSVLVIASSCVIYALIIFFTCIIPFLRKNKHNID